MINSLFTVDIATIQIKDWNNKKLKLKKIIDKLSYVRKELTNYETTRFINDPKDLRDGFNTILKSDISKILKECGIKKINIKDIWAVKYKTGDFQTVHHHGRSMYTGILYVDIDNKMAGTYFVSPMPNPITGDTQLALPEVKEGMLSFFPGYLLHYTKPNQSKNDRVVISFDFDIGEF